ncbi:uncharacterized protein LOC126891380 [Diabrotica virgifera virgifera]|uniref:Myb-like domain-containing protein n=1 Tax=Diabrotica virgifera virgifera TaxID=50390 RepID=A0ABM5L245_DIAVI|nr:uncharacterized protein LOC126891380 [Diabrotica virgifera virgifera]
MDNDVVFGLQEYIIFDSQRPGPSSQNMVESQPKTEYKWNEDDSKILLDLYAKYKLKLGTFEIKNTKVLWIKISEQMKEFGVMVTPNNCLNRWRVLERNYKKFVYNQNKTGEQKEEGQNDENVAMEQTSEVNVTPKVLHAPAHPKASRLSSLKETRKSELEKTRTDRATYYKDRLQLERDKLEKIKIRNALIQQRNTKLENRNKLLEASNKLLEEQNQLLRKAAKIPILENEFVHSVNNHIVKYSFIITVVYSFNISV